MEQKEFRMMVLIATPKLADKAAELLAQNDLIVQYRLSAEGTASSDIMDALGLGSVDKAVVVSTVPRSLAGYILRRLHIELRLDTQGSGIAFTLPLTGASNITLRMMTHAAEQAAATQHGKDDYAMTEIKYTLISAIVNRGFSGDVMEAARTAGARGGTVVHSRCIENKEAAGLWGLGLQEEKELVLILAEVEDKLAIMRAVSEACGMHSEAKGLVVSLPVDSVMGV